MDSAGGVNGAVQRRITVRDVAAAAGVSAGVASVVLRNAASTIRVGAQTRERVRRAAERLGYAPNAAARALRTGRTQTIGVAVRQLTSPFFAVILEGVEAACRAAGYHLLLGDVHSDASEEQAIVGLLSHGRADGLLVLGELPHDEEVIGAARRRGTPTVLVARASVGGAPAVTLDYALGIRLALDHLRALGHRSVALPVYPEGRAMPTSRLRLSAAGAYAAEHGWPPPRAFDVELAERGGLSEWLAQAVAADPPLTTVLASDRVAVHVLKAARRAGVDVPAALSVVALDGTEVATYTTPELTSVTQPLAALGSAAVESLLGLLGAEGGESDETGAAQWPGKTTVLAPGFTVRDSTGPAARGATTPGRAAGTSGGMSGGTSAGRRSSSRG